MNHDPLQQPHSASSVSTFSKPHSVHSSRAAASTVKTYINTAPPWAKDEPPSPKEEFSEKFGRLSADPRNPSEVASLQSSVPPTDPGPSRWWTFARHRQTDSGTVPLSPNSTNHQPRRPRDAGRSMSIPWLTGSMLRKSQDQDDEEMAGQPSSLSVIDIEAADRTDSGHSSEFGGGPRLANRSRLRINMPPPTAQFTLAQNATPGWETPWASAHPNGSGARIGRSQDAQSQHEEDKLSPWQKRRKRIRTYVLYNVYVPLLFRLCNIALTSAALGIGITIRNVERRNGVMGALGPSPTLVIIFGSFTLLHVMIAIYFEYFGRPLGLWRTSWKLAYTLFEVVFICTWSGAFALSFDNFFTSLIPCSPPSSISWYSQLPRPALPNGINGFEGGVGDTLCDDQLALICLVGVGLLMYCFNLCISLLRIFEKVKFHPTSVTAV